MPIDHKLLLYSLASTFNSALGIEICEDTQIYIQSKTKTFNKLPLADRMYYTKYSLALAQSLTEYIENVVMFELQTDPTDQIVHDFRLVTKKGQISYICMSHNDINIRDIIPIKLMKICGYKKNTNVSKGYMAGYEMVNETAHKKIKHKTKYSEIPDKLKKSAIYEPMCNLVFNTLSKKRKCAKKLYDHLFSEPDRIVLRLYKNRFTVYDFGKTLETNSIDSFRMKSTGSNEITINFSNGSKFIMVLQTNALEIKEQLSIKFHTTLKNMDDLYAIVNISV